MWSARVLWFTLLCSTIASVSLYDTYLIVRFSDMIRQHEMNPVGCWLIDLGAGEVGVFVRAKLAGTLIVMATLVTMFRMRSSRTIPIATSLAASQVALFAYLTLA